MNRNTGNVQIENEDTGGFLTEDGLAFELGDMYCYIKMGDAFYHYDTIYAKEREAREETWNDFAKKYNPDKYEDVVEKIINYQDATIHRFRIAKNMQKHYIKKDYNYVKQLPYKNNGWKLLHKAKNIKYENIQKYLDELKQKKTVREVWIRENKKGLYYILYSEEEVS